MTGHTPFQALIDKMTPSQRAKAEKRRAELRDEMALHELRQARQLTQETLGDMLQVGQAAIAKIRGLTAEAEIGETYLGTVSRIVDFGAFVEIFPGTDGLLHISEIAEHRVRDVRDELKEGQQILVKCIGKEGNKIKLSRKAILRDEKQKAGKGERAEAAGQGEAD